jgi:ribosomal protein S27E
MPYVRCADCGQRSFSAAYRLTVDYCAVCAAELPRPVLTGASIAVAEEIARRPRLPPGRALTMPRRRSERRTV